MADVYFAAASEYVAVLAGIQDQTPGEDFKALATIQQEFILDYDDIFTERRSSNLQARAKLRLLGATKPAAKLQHLSELMEGIRMLVRTDYKLPTKEKLAEYRAKMKEIHEQFYKAINYEYFTMAGW